MKSLVKVLEYPSREPKFSGGKCLFVNIRNYLNKLRILVTDDAIEEAFSMVQKPELLPSNIKFA